MQEKIWKLTWWWTWQLWLVLKELQLVSLEACSTVLALAKFPVPTTQLLASNRQRLLCWTHLRTLFQSLQCRICRVIWPFGHFPDSVSDFWFYWFSVCLVNVWTFLHELGKYHGSIVTNDENMELWCVKAGQNSADLVHPMPYSPELHFREFNSAIADAKNSVAVRTCIS